MKLYPKTSARHRSRVSRQGWRKHGKDIFPKALCHLQQEWCFYLLYFFKWYLLHVLFWSPLPFTFEKLLGSLKGKRTEGHVEWDVKLKPCIFNLLLCWNCGYSVFLQEKKQKGEIAEFSSCVIFFILKWIIWMNPSPGPRGRHVMEF